MRFSSALAFLGLAAVLSMNTGCLMVRHNTNVLRKDEKPKAVQFESPQVKNIFDGKLVDVRANKDAANFRFVAFPLLFWTSTVDVVSDNGVYNDQLAICDTNGDGLITIQEVTTYAVKVDADIAKRREQKDQTESRMAKFDPNKPWADSSKPSASAPSSAVQPASAEQPLASPPPGAAMQR